MNWLIYQFEQLRDAELAYDWATIITIVCISFDFFFFTYLSGKLSFLTRAKSWRWGLRILAGMCLTFGIIRLVVVLMYFEDFRAKLIFPVTSIMAWALVSIFGYALYKFILKIHQRTRVSVEGLQLMEEIQKHVIERVLNGHEPEPVLIERYKAKTAAFAAKL